MTAATSSMTTTCNVTVKCSSREELCAAFARYVDTGTLFLPSRLNLEIGRTLTLQMFLRDGTPVFSAGVQVLEIHRDGASKFGKPGIRFRLRDLDAAARAMHQQLLAARSGQKTPAPVRLPPPSGREGQPNPLGAASANEIDLFIEATITEEETTIGAAAPSAADELATAPPTVHEAITVVAPAVPSEASPLRGLSPPALTPRAVSPAPSPADRKAGTPPPTPRPEVARGSLVRTLLGAPQPALSPRPEAPPVRAEMLPMRGDAPPVRTETSPMRAEAPSSVRADAPPVSAEASPPPRKDAAPAESAAASPSAAAEAEAIESMPTLSDPRAPGAVAELPVPPAAPELPALAAAPALAAMTPARSMPSWVQSSSAVELPPRPAIRWWQRRQLQIAAAAGVLVIGGLGTWLARSGGSASSASEARTLGALGEPAGAVAGSASAAAPASAAPSAAASSAAAPAERPSAAAAPCRASIASQPRGATVWLGQRKLGTTPLAAVSLPCGAQAVTLRRSRYEDAALTVDSSPARPGSGTATLERPPADLRLQSRPAGASWKVNGRAVGRGPLALTVPRYETVRLEATLPGHRPFRKKVYLRGPSLDLVPRLTKR